MKFLAVFLALIVFAGSQASTVSKEPSDIFHHLRSIFGESFHNSELGQEIVANIADKISWAQHYKVEAQKQLQQLVETFTENEQEMNQKVQPLVESLAKVLGQVQKRMKTQLQSYAENLEGRFQEMQEGMAPYAQQVCQKLCPVPNP